MSCRVCNKGAQFIDHEFEDNYIEVSIYNGVLNVDVTPNDEYPEYFKMVLHEMSNHCEINFCPYCGDQLVKDEEIKTKLGLFDIFKGENYRKREE